MNIKYTTHTTQQRNYSAAQQVDESFTVRATRVQHELSTIHCVVMKSHTLEHLNHLREQASRIDLWDNPVEAAQIVQQLGALESREKRVMDFQTRFLESKELYLLASEEQEQSLMLECMQQMHQLEIEVKELRVELLLSHESDPMSCFLEIQAGAGGTESCDWVEMLATMYGRWATSRDFSVLTADVTRGEEAGFRSICLRIDGSFAYGWTKLEAGVHRLIRISPFDNAKRRHTSFAQVRVFPILPSMESHKHPSLVDIPLKDLRIDTYRSSGAGGQHVNTTDSAIRITHLPTNLVVTCQSDRSQHRNKAEAMNMLRAKLYQRQLEAQVQEKQQYTHGLGDNGWGYQIRSYVLHPYQQIKDHRTQCSTNDVKSVLEEGKGLDQFMEETLLL